MEQFEGESGHQGQVGPVPVDSPDLRREAGCGTLPTVFTVPFTDGRSLGDNGQLADLTKYAKALPYFNKFNPAVIAEGTDSKGQVVAIPRPHTPRR